MNDFITITWNSCAGKTCIAEELVKRGWKLLYNYTTRPPRDDKELDSYIFLTDKQYEDKKALWHFADSVEYQGWKYAMSNIMPEWNIVAVVTPHWREQFQLLWEEGTLFKNSFNSFFVSIDKKTQKKRLENRKTHTQAEIKKRLDDSFEPTSSCHILNGKDDSVLLADEIENILWL